jgi:hypothetical protein
VPHEKGPNDRSKRVKAALTENGTACRNSHVTISCEGAAFSLKILLFNWQQMASAPYSHIMVARYCTVTGGANP